MATSSLIRSAFRKDLFLGRVAVVTGGGTGIGKAITTELASLGCKVVIASRKMENLEAAAAEINQQMREDKELAGRESARVFPFKCNIRKEDEVRVITYHHFYIHTYLSIL